MGLERKAQITDRDRRVLKMLAEHRAIVVPQVAQMLGVSERTAGLRLRRLQDLRLVSYNRIFEGQPACVTISRRGLGVIESTLPPPRIDLKEYRHDIGVGWLWLSARANAFGAAARVIGEREMRSSDLSSAPKQEPFGIGLPGFDAYGRRARHYPDLLLERASGQRVAIELELTAKSARRLDTIMRAYAGAGRIDAALYVVQRGPVERAVNAAVARAGISELVLVRRLASSGIAGAETGGRDASARGYGVGAHGHGTGGPGRGTGHEAQQAGTSAERSR